MNQTKLKLFTHQDRIPNALIEERIAILGYGNLGRSFALNLRDAGLSDMVIGNIADDYAVQAKRDGFEVVSIKQAARADVVLVLLPDEVIPEVFSQAVAPQLAAGSAVVFASGYPLAYQLITPPLEADVLLLAPRMAGEAIRERYARGDGFHAFISVEQDHSGRAWKRLLGLADAAGALRGGALELSARQEADLDLFIEQTVGALIGMAILNAFAVGISKGIPAEAILMELYMSGEMETVWQAFREKGFFESSSAHGPTAMYGGIIRSMQLMQSDLESFFQNTFEEIHEGKFAAQFQEERDAGYPMLSMAKTMNAGLGQITDAEGKLRSMLEKDKQPYSPLKDGK